MYTQNIKAWRSMSMQNNLSLILKISNPMLKVLVSFQLCHFL